MNPRKKRIVRSLDLDEISAVGTPAQSRALHAITKSERVTEPGPLVLTGEQRRRANEWANSILKSREIQKESTTMNDITKDYATLCKHYSEKWDVTPEAAGTRLMNDRPDLVAKAYEAEQARYVAGIEARRQKVYGS